MDERKIERLDGELDRRHADAFRETGARSRMPATTRG
jgi:hypothetical protein